MVLDRKILKFIGLLIHYGHPIRAFPKLDNFKFGGFQLMLSLKIRNSLRILKSILLKVAKIWFFPQTQDGRFCAIGLFVDWFWLDEATLGMFCSVLMLGIYYTSTYTPWIHVPTGKLLNWYNQSIMLSHNMLCLVLS